MKKTIILVVIMVLGLLALAACTGSEERVTDTAPTNGSTTSNASNAPTPTPTPAGITGPIDVISREAGSGTRGAFIEVLGIEQDGVDRTYVEAVIQTGTGAVITAVAGNESAIGYISLGALRDDVRAVPINGVVASAVNVQNGSYPLFRNFNLAVPRELSELAQDFLDFILSAEGQAVVAANYIAVGDNLPAFTGGGISGTLEVTGSTSVAPLMERLAVAYMELNDGVGIEVHSSGSGAGITDAIEGRADFGMSSRELRASELESVDNVLIAHDGLAVIVHNSNNIVSLAPEQVRDIFMGELSRWDDAAAGVVVSAAPAVQELEPVAVGMTGPIDVISREAGSGTRGAFIEVLGIEEGGVDRTYIEAVIQTGTGAVITAVAGNESAIGYISLGALRDDVRAVPINGVVASAANVQNGSYPLFRNFNLAVPRELSELAQDFLDFIMSAEGQAVVAGNYIAVAENLPAFTGGGFSGNLEITGSTSVAPLMERLAVAYMDITDGVNIEVHSSGSGAGITDAIEGRADFGMSSRELRASELESVDNVLIAHDGLAVIVHNSNSIASLAPEQVRDIFMGELSRWDDASN